MHRATRFLIGAALLAPLGWAGTAQAQMPNCNDPMFPNPIVMAGSSAIEPTLAKMAVKLAAQNVTIIYKPTASCDGPNAITNDTVLTGNADYYVVNAADATKVDIKNCSLDNVPTKALIGISDVSYNACVGALPANLGDYQAMVQAMLLVVPELNKTTTTMSAEQAQVIWGCGMKGANFTDETAIQQRNAQSGTQIMVSKYIGLSAEAMKGHANAKTGDLVASLLAVPDPQKAIGFVAADAYETRRGMLNALAFRGFDQMKAYYPDSDANAVDKINVRDGHYVIQGPLHLITKVDGNKAVADANAKKMIDWLQGTADIEVGKPATYIDIVAGIGNVPQCAMKVRRESDGGFLQAYKPAAPCGCYFVKAVTKAEPAGCTACTSDTTCGDKKCRFGYCE